MHIITTTFVIHTTIYNNWKKFIKEVYIPLSLDELKFDDVNIYQVLVDGEKDQLTYAVQLKTRHMEYIQFYQKEIQPRLLRELEGVFKQSVVHFTSVLKATNLDG